MQYFKDLFQMEHLQFDWCLKPKNAAGHPSLVLFSDGSEEAFGSCGYTRWQLDNGK